MTKTGYGSDMSEAAKRNILGLTATRLFNLDVPALQTGTEVS